MNAKHQFNSRGIKRVLKDRNGFTDFVENQLDPETGKIRKEDEELELNSDGEPKIDYLRDLKNKDGHGKEREFLYTEKNFNWLMKHLMPPNSRLSGCELNIPDIALFENGKPKHFLQTDKDGCINEKMKKKLTILDFQKYFSNLGTVRKRRLHLVGGCDSHSHSSEEEEGHGSARTKHQLSENRHNEKP